jgi:hypothetical protein
MTSVLVSGPEAATSDDREARRALTRVLGLAAVQT